MNGNVRLALSERDGSLQSSIVAWVIAKIESGDVADLLQAGVNPDALDSVRQISARLQTQLSTMRRPFIAVEVNFDLLKTAMSNLRQGDEYRDQVAYFVVHGATNPMLRELFGMSRSDITLIRQQLTSSDGKGGRTALPEHAERQVIIQAWVLQVADSQCDRRQRFTSLHKSLDAKHSLATLFAIVTEHELSYE